MTAADENATSCGSTPGESTRKAPLRTDAVPDTLRERPQWLMWDCSADAPRRPHWAGNFGVSWSDPDAWHTFGDAVDAANRRDSWGVGYVTAADNDDHPTGVIAVLDIDGAAGPDDNPKDWVPPLDPFIERGAYIEWSPSHTEPGDSGLHIPLAAPDVPAWWSDTHRTDAEHEGVDVLTNKFCTVTGDRLQNAGADVVAWGPWVDEWLADAYENLTGETAPPRQTEDRDDHRETGDDDGQAAHAGEWLDEAGVREALDHVPAACSYEQWRNVGFALADFFDSKATAKRVFEDWSRGCSKWDGDAPELADRIIEDAKGDAGTGDVTIATVVELAKEHDWTPTATHPSTDGGKSESDSDDDDGGDDVGGWDEVRHLFNSDEAGTTTKAYEKATQLVTEKHDFVTIRETDELYFYDGSLGYYVRKGETYLREFLKEALPDHMNNNRWRNIREKAKAATYIHTDEFHPPDGKVCVENGVLTLDTRDLEDHSPDYYFTARLQTPYRPDADADRWPEFLAESVTHDAEARKLEEFIGYCLEGWHHNREKNLFVVGPRQSGKSTFLHVLQSLFGDAPTVTNLTPQQLADTQFDASNLKEALLNAVNDINATKIEDSGTLKRIFSGERLKLERKYQDAHFGAPKAKHAFTANWLPTVVGQDESLYRRVLIVEFPNKIDDDERDEGLKQTLEAELPRILNRALDARDRLHEQGGFTNDRDDRETRRTWDSWRDAHKRFLYTNFEITGDSDDRVEKDTYYRAYKEYAGQEGYELKPKQGVTKSLEWVPEIGVHDDEYSGLTWTDDSGETATQTGLSDVQDERVTKILHWIDEFGTPARAADRQAVLDYAEQQGIDRSTAEHTIESLLRKGEVVAPEDGRLRCT